LACFRVDISQKLNISFAHDGIILTASTYIENPTGGLIMSNETKDYCRVKGRF
jgi:hypothetical protein